MHEKPEHANDNGENNSLVVNVCLFDVAEVHKVPLTASFRWHKANLDDDQKKDYIVKKDN